MKREISIAARTAGYLAELLSDVYKAIEFGNAYALANFEADGETVQNTHLFDTMRYKCVVKLIAMGYKVKDLSLNGIHIFYKGYEIKVVKETNAGRVPIAGGSASRFRFYNHNFGQQQLDIDGMQAIIDDLGLEDRRELLILYKVRGDGMFLGLDLVCVEEAPLMYGFPLVSWKESVAHPALSMNTQDKYSQDVVDLGNIDKAKDDRDDDLDIFRDGTNS